MARTSTYLNFPGTTEAAFAFYKGIFGGDFIGPINRMGEAPSVPGMPPMPEEAKNLIMHIELAITGGHVIMGTDAVESMGHPCVFGNNVSLNLEPDSRAEADRLFAALSAGGKVMMPLTDMFWGAYFGQCIDQYGTQWMMNFQAKP